MSKKAAPSVDEILDAINYKSERLPHPVELLTIEQAARHASIPKTTIDSAVAGSEQFRSMVFAEAILALPTIPGPAVWEALRRGLASGSTTEAMALLLDARALEIGQHPALALFMSGFDALDDPRIAEAVRWVSCDLVRQFLPFVETAIGETESLESPLFNGEGELVVLHVLLVESFRRMARFPDNDDELDRRLTRTAVGVIEGELSRFQCASRETSTHSVIGDPEHPPTRVEGRLRDAVIAGAELLIAGKVPFSIGMTVDEIAEAAGTSVATFYRRFGSLAGFERALLDRVGHELMMAFPDEFFDELLEGVRVGLVDPAEGLARFNAAGAERTHEHIENGRPGRHVTPWLGAHFDSVLFETASSDILVRRAEFYEEFTKMAGLTIREGLNGAAIAELLGTHSAVAEGLVRAATDRDRALMVFLTRLPLVNSQFFG